MYAVVSISRSLYTIRPVASHDAAVTIQCAAQDAKNPNPYLQLVVLQMHAAGNMLRYPAACILSAKS
jgi:hypothetical protein